MREHCSKDGFKDRKRFVKKIARNDQVNLNTPVSTENGCSKSPEFRSCLSPVLPEKMAEVLILLRSYDNVLNHKSL